MTVRIFATVSIPASSVMVGGITARIQRLPSSSLGRNSVPSRNPRLRHSTRNNAAMAAERSEEHTSELQSRQYLVCRLLLEKKKETQEASHKYTRQRRL